MLEYSFTYANYGKLCNLIKKTGLLSDYKCVIEQNIDRFIILRHDVDLSVKRAYELGKIEAEHGVFSSFFFMLNSGMYNVLSSENINYLRELSSMGHYIGLHYCAHPAQVLEDITTSIKLAVDVLQKNTGIEVDRFSFHNPTAYLLQQNIQIENLLNAYSSNFFTFNEHSKLDSIFKPEVKYISDSNGKLQYISPYESFCSDLFNDFSKFQILLHPFYWTKDGLNHVENLKQLLLEQKNSTLAELKHNEAWSLEYHDAL